MKIIPLIIASIILISTTSVHAQFQEDEWLHLNRQATKLYFSGKYNAAIPVAEKVLKLAEEDQLVEKDPAHGYVVIVSLRRLAHCHFALEQYYLAEQYYRRALEIWRASVGTPHFNLMPRFALDECTYNLAEIYYLLRRYDQAEALYELTIIFQKESIPDLGDPGLPKSLNRLAKFYRDTNRVKEAEELEKQAKKIQDTRR